MKELHVLLTGLNGSDPVSSTKHRTLNFERRTASKGFTLIEIVVVLFVISLAAMLVFPRLPSSDSHDLRTSARSLAATFRYVQDQAIATKAHYRLHLNIADNSITIGKIAGSEETPPDDNFLGKRGLTGSVTLQDVQIPRMGTMGEGEVIIDFGAGGLEELVTVHLKSTGGASMTITAFPQNGKVQVAEGYQEVKL